MGWPLLEVFQVLVVYRQDIHWVWVKRGHFWQWAAFGWGSDIRIQIYGV